MEFKNFRSKNTNKSFVWKYKKQTIKLTNKDETEFNGKKIKLFQFKLKSTEDLPDDKKLDFDIWLDPKESIIFKVKYNRLGSWEYRLKNYE